MDIKEFKKELRKTDATWKLLNERFNPSFNPDGHSSLEQLITKSSSIAEVISYSHDWEDSEEGYDFWWSVGKECKLLGETGYFIDDAPIFSKGSLLSIGNQIITRKQQWRIFKMLAKRLGYKIIN